MRLSLVALGLLPLALAGGVREEIVQRRRNGGAENSVRQQVDSILEQRQAPAPANSAPPQQQQPSGLPPAAPTVAPPAGAPSSTDTNAACQSQLAKLNGIPSNPSGKSACYNVVAMDNQSGSFQTEVWIYDIGLPTGLWASLLHKGESIQLQYIGAKIEGEGQKMQSPPAGGNPTLNASLLFTGMLNDTMMASMSNPDVMRQALMPMISINAETSDGQFLSTNMSNQEAAFINGLFSDAAFTASQAEAFAATGTPFVLPGTSFGIFPIGFIVTGIWTFFFLFAVGFGTFGRYRFRKSFRRRSGLGASRSLRGGNILASAVAAYDRRK